MIYKEKSQKVFDIESQQQWLFSSVVWCWVELSHSWVSVSTSEAEEKVPRGKGLGRHLMQNMISFLWRLHAQHESPAFGPCIPWCTDDCTLLVSEAWWQPEVFLLSVASWGRYSSHQVISTCVLCLTAPCPKHMVPNWCFSNWTSSSCHMSWQTKQRIRCCLVW